MNLILNVNENLHSIKGSEDGDLKVQSALEEAFAEIKEQIKINKERAKNGLNSLPYKATVKDEYGKELVTIKETRSLKEIRAEYKKKQENYSFENKEKNLLLAMNEIGNSEKDEKTFKTELNQKLNSVVFVSNAELSPTQEKILDYFGDIDGMFSTINFKQDISEKCIKDLIDLPSPKTGKPPKSFDHLLKNIMSINKIFKENPHKEEYIETARTYINLRYQKIIPEEYKSYFKNRGGLEPLISKMQSQELKKEKINSLEFEVSEKNFKKIFQSFCNLEQFQNKPIELAKYLTQRVPAENKKQFFSWLTSIGCNDSVSTIKILTKWSNEAERNKERKNDKEIDKGRGE